MYNVDAVRVQLSHVCMFVHQLVRQQSCYHNIGLRTTHMEETNIQLIKLKATHLQQEI